MKVSLFNNFGARNSVPVFDAIKQGLQALGHQVVHHDLNADAAVIWSVVWHGRMRQNQAIWHHFRSQNKSVIVAEVGMLNRDTTWKVGKNGTWKGCYNTQNLDPVRCKQLNLNLQPWTHSGSEIVIAVQRHDSEQWQGQPNITEWLKRTVSNLKQHTDRPIHVRCHPRQKITVPDGCVRVDPVQLTNTYDSYNFTHGIRNAWAVVNHNSGPGSQSVICGVPSFVHSTSLASNVANLDLSLIETPRRPDREQWLLELAHSEWTIPEIASGVALSRLEPF